MFSSVDQGNEQDETREMWESCRPRKQNKLKSFIELTGTTNKPQNHTLFIVKRKMSSQKNMVQSWFLCCFRFTTQAQLPVQYMDSNGKHLCQSNGRKHMGIATHTRAHTHRHLLYNLCFAIPKKIMTAGIRFPQNNPGTKKWIVSLIFSKTSTSPQQLNDRHMSSFPFSHSALPAHRLNTVSTLTCGGWVSGEFGEPNSPTDNQANQVSPLTGGKTKQNDPIREMRRCFHGCSKMPTANLSKLNCSAAENVKSTWGLELGQFLSGRVKAWGWWILKKKQKPKNQTEYL